MATKRKAYSVATKLQAVEMAQKTSKEATMISQVSANWHNADMTDVKNGSIFIVSLHHLLIHKTVGFKTVVRHQ